MSTTEAKGIALITGASTGIGAIYADRLAKRGHDLILVAAQQGAARIAGAPARQRYRPQGGDGRSRSHHRADLRRVEDILRTNAGISMLVNNAGVGATGPLVSSDVDKMDDMISLNVTALTRLTYAAAPGFVARGNGTIINISSIVAIAPEVLNGVYGGTKAFVLAFNHSLVHELADKGVRVQAVLPGATATEFWDVAGTPVHHLPQQIVMSANDLVDAAPGRSRPRRDRHHPVAAQPGGMGSLRGGAPRHVGQAFERHSGPSLQLAQPRTPERLGDAQQVQPNIELNRRP